VWLLLGTGNAAAGVRLEGEGKPRRLNVEDGKRDNRNSNSCNDE
jgi:hypothetical protein